MKENFGVVGIFPIPLLVGNLREPTQNEKDFVSSLEMKQYGEVYSSLNKSVLDDENLQHLKKEILELAEDYFQHVYNPETKFYPEISSSWINFLPMNNHHQWHTHPNSIVSGVYYFDAVIDEDAICFLRPSTDQWHILPKEDTDFSAKKVNLLIKTGDLVMFPSYLNHGVLPKKSDKSRCSLAFNLIVRGEIGDPHSATYLRL